MLMYPARSIPGLIESTMSISSCSEKTIRIQSPADLLHERTPRLPAFSRAELYSFPDPEDDVEAVPIVATTCSEKPPAKAPMP